MGSHLVHVQEPRDGLIVVCVSCMIGTAVAFLIKNYVSMDNKVQTSSLLPGLISDSTSFANEGLKLSMVIVGLSTGCSGFSADVSFGSLQVSDYTCKPFVPSSLGTASPKSCPMDGDVPTEVSYRKHCTFSLDQLCVGDTLCALLTMSVPSLPFLPSSDFQVSLSSNIGQKVLLQGLFVAVELFKSSWMPDADVFLSRSILTASSSSRSSSLVGFGGLAEQVFVCDQCVGPFPFLTIRLNL